MKYLPLLLISPVAMAGGYHHYDPPAPVIIDQTETIVIDNTETIVIENQETIDNTVTNEYFNTEVIDNTEIFVFDQTVTEQYENTFNDNRIYKGMAMLGAIANIPALSKETNKKMGIGVGAFNYINETAFALGLVGNHEALSYKITGSYDGDEYMAGGGLTFGF